MLEWSGGGRGTQDTSLTLLALTVFTLYQNYIVAQRFYMILLQLASLIVSHLSWPLFLFVLTYHVRDSGFIERKRKRGVLLLSNVSLPSIATPLLGLLYTNWQTPISKEAFRMHPALASRNICSCCLSLITYFFVFMPVKSFSCDTVCRGVGCLVCIWLLDGSCSNQNGAEAWVTASSSSLPEHPSAQRRAWRGSTLLTGGSSLSVTGARSASTTSTVKCQSSVTATPKPSLGRWHTWQSSPLASPARCAHALRHLPSPWQQPPGWAAAPCRGAGPRVPGPLAPRGRLWGPHTAGSTQGRPAPRQPPPRCSARPSVAAATPPPRRPPRPPPGRRRAGPTSREPSPQAAPTVRGRAAEGRAPATAEAAATGTSAAQP